MVILGRWVFLMSEVSLQGPLLLPARQRGSNLSCYVERESERERKREKEGGGERERGQRERIRMREREREREGALGRQ